MKVADSLTFRLSKLTTAFRADVERCLGDLDLHAGQVFVLFELWESDGQSQSDLSSALRVAPPTINRMIKSLVASGFVNCQPCDFDGRVKRVFLTARGHEVKPAVLTRWEQIEKQIYGSLTDAEKVMMGLLFDKLLAGFAESGAPE